MYKCKAALIEDLLAYCEPTRFTTAKKILDSKALALQFLEYGFALPALPRSLL